MSYASETTIDGTKPKQPGTASPVRDTHQSMEQPSIAQPSMEQPSVARTTSNRQDDFVSNTFLQLPPISTRPRPAKLQHAIRDRMITSAELAQRFATPSPKVEIGATASSKMEEAPKVSENIARLQEALAPFDALGKMPLSRFIDGDLKDLPELKAALAKIGDIEANADAEKKLLRAQREQVQQEETIKYQRELKTGEIDAKIDRLDVMIASTKEFEASIGGLRARAADDPDCARAKNSMTLEQAMMVARRGIPFADCAFDAFNDDKLASTTVLEQGVASETVLLKYKDGSEGVFKADPARSAFRNEAGQEINAPKNLGMDKEAPRVGNRNIASRLAGDLLGTNVIPQARYAVHDGTVGLLMDVAPGKAAKKNPLEGKKLTPDETAQLHAQLNELQWTDVLTGQVDRHNGNYFVDLKEGKITVTGIDNDYAFGSKPDSSKLVPDSKYAYKATLPAATHWGGLPALLDGRMFKKIQELNVEEMRKQLAGLLSPEEVDAAVARAEKLKAHALELNQQGRVVSDWKDGKIGDVSISEFLHQQAATDKQRGQGYSSLIARDFKELLQ